VAPSASHASHASDFVRVFGLLALTLNATQLTPLMDGVSDHFDLATRIMLYSPIVAASVGVMLMPARAAAQPPAR
jgi:hypothetical protein